MRHNKNLLPLAAVTIFAAAPGQIARAQTNEAGATVSPIGPARDLPPEQGEAELRAFLVGQGGLTSIEVGRKAASGSFDAAAKRAAAMAAKAKEDQTTASFWPRLQGQARYTRLSPLDLYLGGGTVVPLDQAAIPRPGELTRPLPAGAPVGVAPPFPFPMYENNYSLTGQLSIPVSDYLLRISTALRAAARTARAASAEEEASRRKAAADGRLAYYDWVKAQGQVYVTLRRLTALSAQHEDVKKLAAAGLVSRADLLRSESAVESVELFLLRAQHMVAMADERLRVLMHDDSGTPYRIGEDLIAPLPLPPGFADRDGLETEAIDSRPELKALADTEAAFRDFERLARTGKWPRLDLVGNVQHQNPNQRVFPPEQKWKTTWDANVVLTWTPTDFPAADAAEREQAARALEIRARRQALLDGLRIEIRQAVQSVEQAARAITASGKALGAAEEGYRARRELYRAGQAKLVEVTDAEADLARARLEAIDAHVDARIARVRLEHAVGRDRLD